jgi:hypothetical protein
MMTTFMHDDQDTISVEGLPKSYGGTCAEISRKFLFFFFARRWSKCLGFETLFAPEAAYLQLPVDQFCAATLSSKWLNGTSP